MQGEFAAAAQVTVLSTLQSSLCVKPPSHQLSLMAGVKRSRDGRPSEKKPESDSPYISMFETFKAELDEHHDRRERIIKASRDITAQSKKM